MGLGSSVYKMVFDTQGLNTLTASRRELALQKQIMEETATTSEKLAASEAVLDRMVSKGLTTLEQKTAVLQKLRDELNEVDGSNQKQLDSLKRMGIAQATGIPLIGQLVAGFEAAGPAGAAATAAFMGVATASNLMSGAIHTVIENVSEQIDKIDNLVAQAETINVPVDQFQRLAHAADYANIEQSAFAAGTEKMLVAISKTADGTSKKLLPAFQLARLDVQKLKDMEPGEAFTEITRGLETIPNAADKARAATAIFGSADFLRIDTAHIERANRLMDRLGDVNVTEFGAMDDDVKDMNLALDVTWKKVAMSVVPALGDAATVAREWLVDLNQNETFTDTLSKATVLTEALVLAASEIPGIIESWSAPFDLFITQPAKVALELMGIKKLAQDIGKEFQLAQVTRLAQTPMSENELEKSLGRKLGGEEKDLLGFNKSSAIDDGESEIEHETKSIKDLIDKLKEEVATKGMSTAAAKVWKLEQLGAGEEVLQKNRELAAEFDQLTKTEKAAKAIETFTESLRHQGESAAESARRLTDLKLQHDGVDAATRKSLMTQFDASEAQKVAIEDQKKADAAAKKQADTLVTLGEGVQKEEAKLRGYTSAIGDNEARMRAGERAALEWQLANDKADVTTKAATLSIFDSSTALEKRAKATKTAIDIQEELTKKIRQTFMTDSEKKLDDAKIAGVSDEELKVIATLQKELALREDIHKSITATSGVLKANSREAADAFAAANQVAVRQRFIESNKDREDLKGPGAAGGGFIPPPPEVSFRSPVGGNTVTGAPVDPFDEAHRLMLNDQASKLAPVDPFEEYYRLTGKPNPVGSAMDRGISAASARDKPDQSSSSPPTSQPPKSMIAPQSNELLKLAQKQTEHLAAIREKEPVTITQVEVTL